MPSRNRFTAPLHSLALILHRRPLEFLLALTLVMLFLGAALLFLVERSGNVRSFWDALFLASASATTSESYAVQPMSGLGKLVTVLIAFAGITLSGSFVAAITALIIHGPEPDYERREYTALMERLERIEGSLARLDHGLAPADASGDPAG